MKFLDGSWKQRVTLMMLVALPLSAGGAYLWRLHTPKPRTRTPIVINRNSLLPHRFAGPCLNCHQIKEVGPVSMNRNNMGLFRLMPQQRKLLAAGQSVEVPNAAQMIRTPAIMRDDILPHKFVGVCSNCHIVLDIKPSPAAASKAMDRAFQPLMASNFSRERIARGGTRESHSREFKRNFWGYVSLGFFLLSVVYIAMRGLMRAYPKTFKGKFKVKKWFTIHEWTSSAFCLSAILHWHYSDRGNNLLHLSLLVVIWLTMAGYTLRYRMAQKNTRKNVRLLHTQRFLFAGLIMMLVIGHFFAGFD